MMRRDDHWKRIEQGMAAALREGSVAVPALLLQHYASLKLTEIEAMLLIHLIAFQDKEGKEFPTPDELTGRMSAGPDATIKALQRLVLQQFIQIDEEADPVTGIRSERYNLMPLYGKLAAQWAELRRKEQEETTLRKPEPAEDKDIFTVFEREFARPLTPMECETISGWLDQDQHAIPLILAALKEAVFAGKLHFRYVDRILLEWSRNRVFTPEQAKEYTQKYRGGRPQSN